MSQFKTLAPNGYNIKEIIDGKGRHSKETIKKLCGKKRKQVTKSKYVGINIQNNKYISQISLNKRRIHIGSYNNEIDAAKAYDIKAIKLYGNDCNLNFPELRQDYINNNIHIDNNKRSYKSISNEKNIYYEKRVNKWFYKWKDVKTKKYKTKYFKNLKDALEYKNSLN